MSAMHHATNKYLPNYLLFSNLLFLFLFAVPTSDIARGISFCCFSYYFLLLVAGRLPAAWLVLLLCYYRASKPTS
jgi:hypothetical protein